MSIKIGGIFSASPPGDVVGKVTVGYQGWFACLGDTSPMASWVHWATNPGPSPGHQTFELWPDVREYTNTYQTGYANLGNGQPAKLFGSYDDQTVEVHVKWMSENGIDVAALQRFRRAYQDRNQQSHFNGIVQKIIQNAEKLNQKFYIMWDISGWTEFQTELKDDWNRYVSNFTKSTAYAKQNGKPVVCIWGLGVNEVPATEDQALDVINFLKSEGLYVIGGVPKFWRTGQFMKPNFLNVFLSLDMVSPWTVGSFRTMDGVRNQQQLLADDFAFCNENNLDYQPVIFPGSAWSNHHDAPRNEAPRLHGDFMWQQFVNLRQLGIPNVYIAMFDEFDEGTAIAKAAETNDMIPTDQYFLTLDADGVRVSSDFYLRLVNDGGKMMKGIIPLQLEHPTQHIL